MTVPTVIGHRGARFEAPENTLAGFRYAISLGLSMVEFDVRATADNALVVIHDATVDRTTNGIGEVSEFTLAELQQLDARSMHVLWPRPERIPTFREVMETVTTVPRMEIEIKRDTADRMETVARGIVQVLDDLGRTEGIVVTSFEPLALEMMMAIRPGIARGLIGDWSDTHLFAEAERLQVASAGMNLRTVTPELVQQAKAAGYVTVGWPCNDEDSVRKVLACGFDAVCTDAPSVFAPLFGQAVR